MLNVSRPTAYAWLNGQEPQQDAVSRILRLSRAADRFAALGVAQPETVVRRPVFDGDSLLDILKSDVDPAKAILQIKPLATAAVAARHQPKASGKRLRSIDGIGELSTPATHEPD